MPNRRQFLTTASALASSTASVLADTPSPPADGEPSGSLGNAGIILFPWEIEERNWPALAVEMGLQTISLHSARRMKTVVDYVQSDAGQAFLADCESRDIGVEYELHAMTDLLSREWFYKDATMFRQDKFGKRNQDRNCCPSSANAMEIVAENVVNYASILRPQSGRYFFWTDDAGDWCHCDRCRELSPADQATLIENTMVRALRSQVDPNATLSHLAYQQTLEPPKNVRPDEGLFVELAPSRRSYDDRISDRSSPLETRPPRPDFNAGYLDAFARLQAIFGTASSQVLEYWLDASYFSRWQPPVKPLPWEPSLLVDDISDYAATGAGYLRTFALWIGPGYERLHGKPPLGAFADALMKARRDPSLRRGE